jgi:hypothetical protein
VTKIIRPSARIIEHHPADSSWYPEVKRLYEALFDSPMACTYEQSDVEFAYVNAEVLNIALSARTTASGLNASLIAGCMSAFGRLGITEGDRRRLGIEVEQPDGRSDTVAVLEGYRERLGKK